jgi:hypothetical protein
MNEDYGKTEGFTKILAIISEMIFWSETPFVNLISAS